MAEEKEVKKSKTCSSVNKHYFLTNSEGIKIQVDLKCTSDHQNEVAHSASALTGKKNRKGEPEEKVHFWGSAAEIELVLE